MVSLLKSMRLRNIFLCILVIVISGCDSPVELIGTTLEYRPSGSIGFGSSSPLYVNVKLKLPSGDYKKVKVIYIGDGKEIGSKFITFMSSGRADIINVEYRDREFVYAKNKKIEVTLLSEGNIVKGPYLLEVPNVKLNNIM